MTDRPEFERYFGHGTQRPAATGRHERAFRHTAEQDAQVETETSVHDDAPDPALERAIRRANIEEAAQRAREELAEDYWAGRVRGETCPLNCEATGSRDQNSATETPDDALTRAIRRTNVEEAERRAREDLAEDYWAGRIDDETWWAGCEATGSPDQDSSATEVPDDARARAIRRANAGYGKLER